MARVEADILGAELQLAGIELGLGMLDDVIADLESDKADLEKQIEEMRNPKNFIESDGRRYDSSDNAALQRRNANLWKAYKGGRMTADEYMEEIGKPFDDPGVAEDLAMLKEIILQELEDRLADTQKSSEEAKNAREKYTADAEVLRSKIASLKETLENLRRQLEDCNRRCNEEDVNILEDYGIGQAERSIFDGLLDFFDDLFGEDESTDDPFVELDDFLDGLGEPPEEGGAGDIPTEMIPLDLRGTDPGTADSFFDVFFDTELPPVVCHLCDPIRVQIEETEDSLNDLVREQAQLQAEVDAAYQDIATARSVQDQAKNALDALNNPRSSAESEGRRIDSSDYAAMQVRNARLWGEYRSGERSAQELEAEWEKEFDDPEVQEELNDIKERMKSELEEVIEQAQEAIDNLNAKITAHNERLVELAGLIAAHQAVLEYLLRDLAECERRCRERADVPTNLALPDFSDLIFPDGFETGDQSNPSVDDEEEERPKAGFMDWLRFGGEEEEKQDEKKEGLFCGWFGLFCADDDEKEEAMKSDLTLDDAVSCLQGEATPSDCTPIDINGDGVVDIGDLDQLKLSLNGPNDLQIPLLINDMDGNDSLTVDDLKIFGDCLGGGGSCDGLNFNPPPAFGSAPPDSLIGLTGGDFGLLLNGLGGNDTLFGDPVPDPFVGMDGIPGFDPNLPPPPIPGGFFGPGSDPFAGGPPTFFGPGGNDIFTTPPPPPRNVPESEIVQELVRQALSRLPKLKECEKYVVTVLRQRIGNVTRYTMRVTRTRDTTKCPDQCPATTSFQSPFPPTPDGCKDACQNGAGGCTVIQTLQDGTNCILCGPPIEDDGGCSSDADCDDGDFCTGEELCIQARCEVGIPVSCDDTDECTTDRCDPSTGNCSNEYDEDRCPDEVPRNNCPDFTYASESDCKRVCDGRCVTERFEGDVPCWICGDATFQSSSSSLQEQCDPPMMDIGECERSCEEPDKGKCEKSYTRNDGVSCYSCKTTTQVSEQCPSGSTANCASTCDGTCETVKTLSDGTKCGRCVIEEVEEQCPSGHAKNASDCPSGSTAIPDDFGCYECSVINCPNGTYKNECPSSCSGGCDVAAEQHGVTCYRCKQSCEDLCAGQNYLRVGKDWSDHIQGILNGYTCVSGANISLQTATVGDCTCSNEPSVSVDQTVPVCRDTPCGDVACGQSTSCSVGENTTATVSCNWGGWKKIDMNKFQPILGQ